MKSYFTNKKTVACVFFTAGASATALLASLLGPSGQPLVWLPAAGGLLAAGCAFLGSILDEIQPLFFRFGGGRRSLKTPDKPRLTTTQRQKLRAMPDPLPLAPIRVGSIEFDPILFEPSPIRPPEGVLPITEPMSRQLLERIAADVNREHNAALAAATGEHDLPSTEEYNFAGTTRQLSFQSLGRDLPDATGDLEVCCE